MLHSWLVILSSRVFCCCGEREGKKSTPVTLSMSLTGVRENLSNLDTGEGSWTGTIIFNKWSDTHKERTKNLIFLNSPLIQLDAEKAFQQCQVAPSRSQQAPPHCHSHISSLRHKSGWGWPRPQSCRPPTSCSWHRYLSFHLYRCPRQSPKWRESWKSFWPRISTAALKEYTHLGGRGEGGERGTERERVTELVHGVQCYYIINEPALKLASWGTTLESKFVLSRWVWVERAAAARLTATRSSFFYSCVVSAVGGAGWGQTRISTKIAANRRWRIHVGLL